MLVVATAGDGVVAAVAGIGGHPAPRSHFVGGETARCRISPVAGHGYGFGVTRCAGAGRLIRIVEVEGDRAGRAEAAAEGGAVVESAGLSCGRRVRAGGQAGSRFANGHQFVITTAGGGIVLAVAGIAGRPAPGSSQVGGKAARCRIASVAAHRHGLSEDGRAGAGGIVGVVQVEGDRAGRSEAAAEVGGVVEGCPDWAAGRIRGGVNRRAGLDDGEAFGGGVGVVDGRVCRQGVGSVLGAEAVCAGRVRGKGRRGRRVTADCHCAAHLRASASVGAVRRRAGRAADEELDRAGHRAVAAGFGEGGGVGHRLAE